MKKRRSGIGKQLGNLSPFMYFSLSHCKPRSHLARSSAPAGGVRDMEKHVRGPPSLTFDTCRVEVITVDPNCRIPHEARDRVDEHAF